MLNIIRKWKAAKALADARAVRLDILRIVRDAEARNDTREIGRGRMMLSEATLRELMAGRG